LTPVPSFEDFQGSRPPPAHKPLRATIASVVGHGVALTLLAFVGVRSTAPFSESPLIVAELVTFLEPAAAPAAEAATGDVALGAAPVTPVPEPPAPPERPARVEPAVVAPSPEPDPEPPAPAVEAERPLEPAEAPAVERLVEVPEPPAATVAAEERSAAISVEPVPAVAPSRSLASHEERAVLRKLSSWTGRFSADDPDAELTWREDGQEYTAVLKQVPASDAMGMGALAVELSTERDGERLVTELRMNRLAFSNFGQFVNEWDPDVSLHDDIIDGRFHSNTELTIGRTRRTTPEFRGRVTIAGGSYTTGDGPGFISRQRLFPAGIETRTRRIELPNRAAALDAIARPDNSQRFERDAALTFHADGTVSWRDVDTGYETSRSLGEEPFYVLAFEDVELEIRGTVNGKVLVYARERIVIADDLRYAVDPRTPHADDYLGLVAERTVEIAEPDVTGPGDLEVFASIYARQRFVVRNFTARRSGTLVIHGSLTAGTLSASEPRFATKIEFDNRLTTMRAPSFPLSDRYELDSTTGEWRVVGPAN
jgi:hypothetical protein